MVFRSDQKLSTLSFGLFLAAPRQCLMLKLKGVPQSEAQKLFVEVVFEVHGLLISLDSLNAATVKLIP